MDLEKLIKYCLSQKGASEDYPFGPEPLVMKIASKMFSLISEKDGKIHISLKCDPFIAQSLRQQYPAIKPGYHLNKEHWNTVIIDGTIPDKELKWMIQHSYDMVIKTLIKKERETILK